MQPLTSHIECESDVCLARMRGRQLATDLGFSEMDCRRIEIVILELTHNLLSHAGGGQLSLAPLLRNDHYGIAISTHDNGPGISDIDRAMCDGWSTTRTLGVGLPSVKRLMDGLTIETTPGVGTSIRAFKWVLPKRPQPYCKGKRV